MAGKTILITGASSGIGEGLALAYGLSGNHLLLVARNIDRLQKIAEKCIAQGATIAFASIDVREKSLLSEWIVEQDQKTPIDLVIANAGISTAQAEKTFQRQAHTFSEVDEMLFDINLQGMLNTLSPIIPRMQQRHSGQIVIMSSLASYVHLARFAAYSASKAAVRSYGLALRGFLKKDGIKVNVICPGFIKTPLTDENNFRMVLIMSVQKAVKLMIKSISKNKPLIAFPWRLYFACRLYQFLPGWLQNLV